MLTQRREFLKIAGAGATTAAVLRGRAWAQAAPNGLRTLAANTWTPRPAPQLGKPNGTPPTESTGPYPAGLGGKLSRCVFSVSQRALIVSCGGTYYTERGHPDYNANGTTGMPTVWALDLSQGAAAPFQKLHGLCPLAGEEMPGRPHSCCVGIDDKRQRMIVLPGWMASSQTDDFKRYAAICPGVVQVLDAMIFDFSTRRWARAPWGAPPWGGGASNYEKYGGDDCSRYGVVDPVTDCMYRIERRSGSVMAILHLDGRSQPWEGQQFTLDVKVVSSQLGLDVKGRRIWFIAPTQRMLLGWHIDSRRLDRQIPLPAEYVAPEDPSVHSAQLAWFDTPGAAVMPGIVNFYGTLHNLIIFWDSDRTIEVRPGDPAVAFNTFQYDPLNDAGFGCGVAGGGGGNMSVSMHHWLYRLVRGGVGAPKLHAPKT